MTPKSLLRHKKAVSTLKEMGPGSSFHRVLWDDAEYMQKEVLARCIGGGAFGLQRALKWGL